MTLPFMLVAEFAEFAELARLVLIRAGHPNGACTSACSGGRNTLKPGLRFDPPLPEGGCLECVLNLPRDFERGFLSTLNFLMRKAPGR